MPPKQNKRSGLSVTPGKNVFRGVRDPVVADARSTSLAPIQLAATIEIGNNIPICPMGVNSVSVGSGGTLAASSVLPPALPFLYRTASNFQQYRITRAALVFVSNQSPTATGRVTLSGSVDFADGGTAGQQFGLVSARQFDMAGLANKEARFQLPVDPSWKKVSATLNIVGNGNTLITANTMNDIVPSFAQFYATGTTGSGNIGLLFVEYDVEFKGPVSTVING